MAREDNPSNERMARRERNRRKKRATLIRNALVTLMIVLLCTYIGIMLFTKGQFDVVSLFAPPTPSPTPTLAPTPSPTPTPTPTPTPSPTPVPTPTPDPRGYEEIDAAQIVPEFQPGYEKLMMKFKVSSGGTAVEDYQREEPLIMGPASEYAALEGITTFRGNNYRDSAAYGVVPADANALEVAYTFKTDRLDTWYGAGWTGQPAIVRWSPEARANMNIIADKRDAPGDLIEVIYAALDGNIYFFDLMDNLPTREPIKVGMPIKGSVTVDPRGYPLIYVGQGVGQAKGKDVKTGMRAYSLIDQKELMFVDVRDKFSERKGNSVDTSPLVDAATDTVIWSADNGIIYFVKLNTDYDADAGTIELSPAIDRLWYNSKVTTKRPGMDNSPVIYNHYLYSADNAGLIQCIDINTLTTVWAVNSGDATHATLALEEAEPGTVSLYTGNAVALRGSTTKIQLRSIDALSGAQRWRKDVEVTKSKNTGGMYAAPAVGKGTLADLVYFNVARTDTGGTLYALDKATGEEVWTFAVKAHSWSSPTLVYDEDGYGYVVLGDSKGGIRLIDGLTGDERAILALDGAIDASPAVFDDMIVVGTRAGSIYSVRITHADSDADAPDSDADAPDSDADVPDSDADVPDDADA